MFCVDKYVGFSDIAPDYGAKITKLIDYFQDTCIRQSEALNAGVGVKDLREKGMCWVLSSWQIVIDRYPTLDEHIMVCTAPYQFKGVMGSRNFWIQTESGETIVRANSIWSFVDIENMMLTKVPQYVADAYEPAEPIEMDYAPRKIKVPEELTPLEPVKINYHNLDVNNHVNNAQYIALAEDAIPEGRRSKQIRAEYRNSAKAGDVIFPYINRDENGKLVTVVLADEEKKPYVIVEFGLE